MSRPSKPTRVRYIGMNLEDLIRAYKGGKISKEEFERRISELSEVPADLLKQADLKEAVGCRHLES